MHQCVQGSKHTCTSASLTQCSCLNATVVFPPTNHNTHNQAGSQSASAMYASVAGCSRRTNTSVEHSHEQLSTDDIPVQATAPLGDVTCLNCLRRTLAVRDPRCRTMCTSQGVPAADTGTRMAQRDGCSLKDPDTRLTQAACAF